MLEKNDSTTAAFKIGLERAKSSLSICFDGMDVDMLIRFTRAGAELETVADFAFDFFEDFFAREGADFEVADILAVVNREPAGGEAFDRAD
jgi:hypothetical protein